MRHLTDEELRELADFHQAAQALAINLELKDIIISSNECESHSKIHMEDGTGMEMTISEDGDKVRLSYNRGNCSE